MEQPEKWNEEQNMLTRTLQCKDFMDAVSQVNRIAELAEEHDHHPDLSLHGYNQLTISMTSHDQGHVVTEKDYALAEAINKLF